MSSIKIDRPFLRNFTAEAEAALRELCEKYGITVSYKSGNFQRDGSNAILKFEIAAPDATTGEAKTRASQDFKRLASRYGLSPDDLGTTFKQGRTEYRITGINPRARQYPICGARVRDGKPFRFTVADVLAGRGAAVEGLTPEIKRAFVGLACGLSPENLSCDGEASTAHIRRVRAGINAEWRALEARAGRKVSESDAWGFSE